jgi:hypothetical protein
LDAKEVIIMMCSLAKLETDKLDAVKGLENELGKTLLAFSCGEAKPAELKEEELARIKEVEGNLGLSLVAVD